jgi:DNA-binding response OmpR family regulator
LLREFQVKVAVDGQDALDQAAYFRPEVVVTDWMMPNMDGLELCQAIRADPALAPCHVIVLTAKTLAGDRIQALDADADDVLRKPCDHGELLARIRSGVRRVRRTTLNARPAASAEWLQGYRTLEQLSHDFLSPMHTALKYLYLLKPSHSHSPDEGSEFVQQALEALEQAADLGGLILDYARSCGEQLEARPGQVQVQETAVSYQPSAVSGQRSAISF